MKYLIFGAGLALLACLPADVPPAPARVTIAVRLSPELLVSEGQLRFDADDGAVVSFDRLLVSLGQLELDGDETCNAYSEGTYLRVLDLLQPGPQRVGDVWGLSRCRFGFSAQPPSNDAVLGAGVSAETRARGRTFEASGSIAKAGRVDSFVWELSDQHHFTECGALEQLHGGEQRDLTLEVDPRRLLRGPLASAFPTLFRPLLGAPCQVNQDDGEVTFGP